MKKSIMFLLLMTLLILSACLIPLPEINYVEGEVGIGIQEETNLEEFARYVYSFDDITIKNITSFRYYSTLPLDSIDLIRNSLSSKPYNRADITRVNYNEDSTRIEIDFWVGEFTPNDSSDWKETKRIFELHHINNYFQIGLISVPIGEELDWITIFKASPLIRFAELNYINHGCD